MCVLEAVPGNQTIKPCERELSGAKWVTIEEFKTMGFYPPQSLYFEISRLGWECAERAFASAAPVVLPPLSISTSGSSSSSVSGLKKRQLPIGLGAVPSKKQTVWHP